MNCLRVNNIIRNRLVLHTKLSSKTSNVNAQITPGMMVCQKHNQSGKNFIQKIAHPESNINLILPNQINKQAKTDRQGRPKKIYSDYYYLSDKLIG